ncbi:hypothetical protein SCLCIDRAFT_796671 [Scleroderma citrinum Foug A]|uniref:Uncharacterized protein n=1 Tax=Scleroderma citrinum Foug A TaxID=1036808 RepID=A0A0C3E2A6_9AGAM|nr:hypothetical protein SCLCIDRAFT_796671 [Scleroderma citrinum Foug A]
MYRIKAQYAQGGRENGERSEGAKIICHCNGDTIVKTVWDIGHQVWLQNSRQVYHTMPTIRHAQSDLEQQSNTAYSRKTKKSIQRDSIFAGRHPPQSKT